MMTNDNTTELATFPQMIVIWYGKQRPQHDSKLMQKYQNNCVDCWQGIQRADSVTLGSKQPGFTACAGVCMCVFAVIRRIKHKQCML